MGLIAFLLLLPVIYLLFGDMSWLRALGARVRNPGYWQWWLNTMVLAIMVAAVAAPTSAFAGVWAASNRGRALIPRGALGLALLIWRALFVPMGWLDEQREIHPEWLLWLPLSAVATCIGGWLATQALRRDRPELVMRLGLVAAFLVVWQELTLTLIVRQPLAAQAIGPATVSALGGVAAGARGPLIAALLSTTLIAWLSVGIATRRRKNQ